MSYEARFWKLEDQIKAFVASGFKRSKFTTAIYHALSVDSGRFIAHFDKDGFYKARFETREALNQTLDSLTFVMPKNGRHYESYEVKRLLRGIPEMAKQYAQVWAYQDTCFPYVDGKAEVHFRSARKFDHVCNMFNMDGYLSKGMGFISCILEMSHGPILVNSDSIAYDWVLNLPDQGHRISKNRIIVLVHTGHDYKTNGGYTGASEKRLKQAQAKLKALGYKTKYCSSIKAAEAYVSTLKVINKAVR